MDFNIPNPVKDTPVGLCSACQKWGAPCKCSRCKIEWYCNEECQSKDWKKHKKTCSKPDAARRELNAIVHPAVDDVPKLLGLTQRFDPYKLVQPGNQYLQAIVRIACVLNGITEARSSADIAPVDLRFSYLVTDTSITVRRYTVLQLRSAYHLTGVGVSLLAGSDAHKQRQTADDMLHAVTGVRNDPTCCHIPLVFGSNHPSERMGQASHMQFYFVPVLPGVAKKAVRDMRDSGMTVEDWIVGELFAKFNRMVVHDKGCGSRGSCTCAQQSLANWKSWSVE